MPGRGRKAHQLNWALRPDNLAAVLGDGVDASRIWVGVSDADSIPDRNAFRWIAADVVHDGGHEAYQGVTLSLANFDRLDVRGRVCAIQQSSIFIRVSIARLISERRRLRWFAALAGHAPGLARAGRTPPVKNVGKPCAGEPHARFDGRGLETGRSTRNRASPRPSHFTV